MTEDFLFALAGRLASLTGVRAVGLSSDPLPKFPLDGDIDIFVYCDQVPLPSAREAAYPPWISGNDRFRSRVFMDERWGDADYSEPEGFETWIMYFPVCGTETEVGEIRSGLRAGRDNGFYHTARLAMFRNMRILSDGKGFLGDLKTSLASYPEALRTREIEIASGELGDDEDLRRATARGDLTFFHLAFDDAMDAMFRLLFALNRELFPGRKRSLDIASKFGYLPSRFESRLVATLGYASSPGGLGRAFAEIQSLARESLGLLERQ